MRNLFLTNRFFSLFGAVAASFALSYVLPFLFPVSLTAFALALALTLADLVLLFDPPSRVGQRLANIRGIQVGVEGEDFVVGFSRREDRSSRWHSVGIPGWVVLSTPNKAPEDWRTPRPDGLLAPQSSRSVLEVLYRFPPPTA